ncbi:MAG: hypothetical protein ACYDCL_03925 [Myxococcales bacterium]
MQASKKLTKERIPAFYGNDERGLAPNDIYDEQAARAAIDEATCDLATCLRLIGRR